MYVYKIVEKLIDHHGDYIDEFVLGAFAKTMDEKEIQSLLNEMLQLGLIVPAGTTKPYDDSEFAYNRYKITGRARDYVKDYKKSKFRTDIAFYFSIVAILLSIYSTFFK